MEYKGLMIRRALPEDHRSVINIRDIYDGTDYLDYVHPFYMTSENVHGFVAEKDGVIVSIYISLFLSLSLLSHLLRDNRETYN